MNETGCRVSEGYIYSIPVYTHSASQIICEGDEFIFGGNSLTQSGIYVDTFTTTENCDSIVTLNLEVRNNTIDNLPIHIVKGSTFEFNDVSYRSEGDYPIHLTTINGCDSLIILQLSVSNIAIPNAFSPNGDGNNDVFRISGPEKDITNITMSIYDRWGERIFVGEEWDGMVGGDFLNIGVFVYSVEVTTILDEKLTYYGNVTLIR